MSVDSCNSVTGSIARSKKFHKLFGLVAATNPPDLNSFLEADQDILEPLQHGALFSTWGDEGNSVEHIFITLDQLNHKITLEWKKRLKTTELDVIDLKLVLQGGAPRDIKALEKNLHSTSKITEENFFTIYYGVWPWEELHLTSEHKHLVKTWIKGLDMILRACGTNQILRMESHGNTFRLQCFYLKLFRKHHGNITPIAVMQHLVEGIRPWKAKLMFHSILTEDPLIVKQLLQDDNKILFSTYHALFLNLVFQNHSSLKNLYKRYSQPPEVLQSRPSSKALTPTKLPLPPVSKKHTRKKSSVTIMMEYLSGSSSSKQQANKQATTSIPIQNGADTNMKESVMSLKSFLNFLKTTQGMSQITQSEVVELIHKYDPLSPFLPNTSGDKTEDYQVTPRIFAAYMLSLEGNAVMYNKVSTVFQDLNQPLTSYFISSSHNTYLSGHQLHGESNVSMYTTILCSGCRCIELDCWDGDNGQPIIYHGHTLVTKISFEDVIKAIAKYAFVASPYPLILSFENHCSIPQQQVMVKIMKREFGHLLLTESIDGSMAPECLPSPEDLKFKILIKNKKIPNSSSIDEQNGKFESCPLHKTPSMEFFKESQCSLEYSDWITEKGTAGRELSSSPTGGPFVYAKDTSDLESKKPKCDNLGTSEMLSLESNSLSFNENDEISTSPETPEPSFSTTNSKMLSASFSDIRKVVNPAENESITSLSSINVEIFDGKAKVKKTRNKNKKKLTIFSSKKRAKSPSEVEEKAKLKEGELAWSQSFLFQEELSTNCELLSQSLDLSNLQKRRRQFAIKEIAIKEGQPNHLEDEIFTERSRSKSLSPDDALSINRTILRTSSDSYKPEEQSSRVTSRKAMSVSESTSLQLQYQSRHSSKGSLGEDLLMQDQAVRDSYSELSGKRNSNYVDTVETACSGKNIAKELSDIVIYLEPLKFLSFKNETWNQMKCTEMFSVCEPNAKKAIKKTATEFSVYNVNHFSRIYPSATRINSSNFSPSQFWLHGCQMVALNYQTSDSPMQHNMSLFQLNNSCGYVEKPKNLHEQCMKYYAGSLSENDKTNITITLISGECLPASNSSNLPTVEIEIIGVPGESFKFRLMTSHATGGSVVWDQQNTISFALYFPELAVMKVTSGTESTSFPLKALQSGYRYLYLTPGHSLTTNIVPFIFTRIHINRCQQPKSNPHSLSVAVDLNGMEPMEISIPVPQNLTPLPIITDVFKKMELDDNPEDFKLVKVDQSGDEEELAYDSSLSQADITTCLFKIKDNSPKLSMIAIEFGKLPLSEYLDPVTLIADSRTVASDLIMNVVSHVTDTSNIKEVLKDATILEDEDQILQSFHFTLATGDRKDPSVIRNLKNDDLIVEAVSKLKGSSFLLFCIKEPEVSPDTLEQYTAPTNDHTELDSTSESPVEFICGASEIRKRWLNYCKDGDNYSDHTPPLKVT